MNATTQPRATETQTVRTFQEAIIALVTVDTKEMEPFAQVPFSITATFA